MKPDYSYIVEKSEKGLECQVKYVDETEVVQARLDSRSVTKLVEKLMQLLPIELLEVGVPPIKCEPKGTKCKAQNTVMSKYETKKNKLGQDG